jgi:hypothetical protein
MLNELLEAGLYTPADRAKLVATAARNTEPLPEIVKAQLPVVASDRAQRQ